MVSIGKGFIIASPKRTTVGATIRCRSQAVSFYAILPDVWPKRNSLELRPEVAIANSGQDKGILVILLGV